MWGFCFLGGMRRGVLRVLLVIDLFVVAESTELQELGAKGDFMEGVRYGWGV